MHRRKIAVVTGTRADYGLLYWPLREIQADARLELQLVVTGMHLAAEFGFTYRAIEEDSIPIACRVPMDLSNNTDQGIANALSQAISGIAAAFSSLAPDIVVLLGDRYEIFAAAQAAMLLRIPIAHLHGGEASEGAMDEAIRHSITKMAHLHFVAAEPYRHRVIQLGEAPNRVFNFGAPGIDNVRRLALLSRSELSTAMAFDVSAAFLLVTYHPVTLERDGPARPLQALFDALDAMTQFRVVFTKANADAGGLFINEAINVFVKARAARAVVFTSLGQKRYLSAMKYASAVVGNSSSGIIEAPSLATPTVNLGSRQGGRLRAASVLDCDEEPSAIVAAVQKAVSPSFRASFANKSPPFGDGHAAEHIRDVLAEFPLEGILMKRFHDLPDAISG